MLLKQAQIEYITGKQTVYDYVLRELVKLINAFNLDVDRCLNEVYGISREEIKMLNDTIMDERTSPKGVTKSDKSVYKRHGFHLTIDGRLYKLYDMSHLIFLWN